jgi:hypothetical protein
MQCGPLLYYQAVLQCKFICTLLFVTRVVYQTMVQQVVGVKEGERQRVSIQQRAVIDETESLRLIPGAPLLPWRRRRAVLLPRRAAARPPLLLLLRRRRARRVQQAHPPLADVAVEVEAQVQLAQVRGLVVLLQGAGLEADVERADGAVEGVGDGLMWGVERGESGPVNSGGLLEQEGRLLIQG